MKILTLSTKDSFGGAGRVAYRLCEEIIRQGYDDILLVNSKRTNSSFVRLAAEFHDPKNLITYRTEKIKYKIKEFRKRLIWNSYPNRADKVFLDIYISYLKNALDRLDFDVLHLHWVGDSYVNFEELPSDKPIVWTLHDCFAFTGVCSYFEDCDKYQTHCQSCPQLKSNKKKDISFDIFELKKKRYASLKFHIVTPSKWLAKSVQDSFLLKNYPVTVIPNGINTDTFRPIDKVNARKLLGLDTSKKIILFGGISAVADPRKGGDLLWESLKILSHKYDDLKEDILLLVFGSEEQNNYIFNFDVKYLGYIQHEEQLNIIYNSADVMVVPSRYENLPNTILESLSSGTPVVAFDIGGNSDMIDHKYNGYLVKPYDVEDLHKGITFCLDKNNGYALSQNARTKVIRNFRIEDISAKYIDLYKKLNNNE